MESMGFFHEVHIAAGDTLNLTVKAHVGKKQGIVEVENLSNGQNGTQEIHLTESLCGKTAEWVVEEELKSSLVNFGKLTFKNARVGGKYFGPQNWTLVDIHENGSLLTRSFVSIVDEYESVTVIWGPNTGNGKG